MGGGVCVLHANVGTMSANSANRESELVTSREDRIIVAMAGRPIDDPKWVTGVAAGCKKVMDKERGNFSFGHSGCIPAPPGSAKRKKTNRRNSKMQTTTQGISYGGGQQVCDSVGICSNCAYISCSFRGF